MEIKKDVKNEVRIHLPSWLADLLVDLKTKQGNNQKLTLYIQDLLSEIVVKESKKYK